MALCLFGQARRQVDAYLAVFFDRVDQALDAFPSYIEGHKELVWDRLNEVIDKKIDAIVGTYKVGTDKRAPSSTTSSCAKI